MILTSKVDIVSGGLALLGQSPISSNEDTGRANQACQRVWDIIRRSRLAAHPWRFAITEQALTPISDETDPESANDYDDFYSRPADALLIWGLQSMERYSVYNSQIGTNASDPYLIYVRDIDAPSLFTPFAEAMMYEMAFAAAITATDSVNKANFFRGLADKQWKMARLKDSQQGWPLTIPLDRLLAAWPTARGG